MSALTDALEKILILTCLQQRFYDFARMFEPGLSYADIEQRVKKLPFKLPKEVYKLYQWLNGTYYAEEDRAGFFNDGLVFLSLEAAINKYEELLGISQDEEVDEEYWMLREWDKNWFPLFARQQDNKDYLFLICDKKEKESSPVFSASTPILDIDFKDN